MKSRQTGNRCCAGSRRRSRRRSRANFTAKDAEGAKEMRENELSTFAVNAALKVHTALGPGLLESAYEACLVHELRKLRLSVVTQQHLPILYDASRLMRAIAWTR